MLILAILEILRNDTDENHRLLQQDLIDLLNQRYGLSATRKAVRRNLQDLIDGGYPVYYNNGWYYEHELFTTELDLLIDSLQANTSIPHATIDSLARKLSAFTSRFHVQPELNRTALPVNPEFSLSYELLRDAIRCGRQVSFSMVYYDVDKQLHPRLNDDGEVKEYIVSPYRIHLRGGYYYLVGNVSTHSNLCHFRLDHLSGIRMLSQRVRPMQDLDVDCDSPMDADYVARHPRMHAGPVRLRRVRARRRMASVILETFGMSVSFENVTDSSLDALILTDSLSLKNWLLLYPGDAEPIGDALD